MNKYICGVCDEVLQFIVSNFSLSSLLLQTLGKFGDPYFAAAGITIDPTSTGNEQAGRGGSRFPRPGNPSTHSRSTSLGYVRIPDFFRGDCSCRFLAQALHTQQARENGQTRGGGSRWPQPGHAPTDMGLEPFHFLVFQAAWKHIPSSARTPGFFRGDCGFTSSVEIASWDS